ncbi:hypothetical protein D1007_40899 [Hordeum vulgare]|nr:hypothetical protein D1007_40899 [Hordeum vulgare]
MSPSPARHGSPLTLEWLYKLVHQARGHKQHRRPLQYLDVNLPHRWHLDPHRIPIAIVPRSVRAHTEEVRQHREDLTPDQRVLRAYMLDSLNWEHWFALNHKEERHRGVHADQVVPPPLLEVLREDEDEAVAYQSTLE